MGSRPKDVSGQKFGRLTAVSMDGRRGGKVIWRCSCECGAEHRATGDALRSGKTRSCGCLSSDVTAERNMASAKHGHSYSTEYKIWQGIHQRCCNPKASGYARYGGRGVVVAPEWGTFEAFLRDMGHRPSLLHSLDRRANDGPYSKDNCRWATGSEQQNNRRDNVIIAHDGRSQPLKVWAQELGLCPATLWNRIKRSRMTTADALRPDSLKARGAKSRFAKLKECDIPRVRQMYADGVSFKQIGARFGAHPDTIASIVHRKTWRHIP